MKGLYLCVYLSTVFFSVAGQDEEDVVEDDVVYEEDLEEDSDDVASFQTSALFPKVNGSRFPAGEFIDVVVSFRNQEHGEDVEVNGMNGYITSIYDAKSAVQNLTWVWLNTTVKQGVQTSFWYRFRAIPETLEVRSYYLVLVMFYKDSNNRTQHHLVYNETAFITEATTALDFKTVSVWVLFLGIIGGTSFGVWYLIWGMKKKPIRIAAAAIAASDAAPVDPDEDFLPASVKLFKGKAASPKKRSPASPKSE